MRFDEQMAVGSAVVAVSQTKLKAAAWQWHRGDDKCTDRSLLKYVDRRKLIRARSHTIIYPVYFFVSP